MGVVETQDLKGLDRVKYYWNRYYGSILAYYVPKVYCLPSLLSFLVYVDNFFVSVSEKQE